MVQISGKESEAYSKNILRDKHFKDLKRYQIVRLSLTYILPFIILIVFFQYEFHTLTQESQSLHLKAIAENQSNLLELFLRERLVNLRNLIDDPQTKISLSNKNLDYYLIQLHKDSDAFIDLGFFDTSGVQIAYAGPVVVLQKRDYSHEPWYINLISLDKRYIFTDIYLGFRQKPHFTVAVSRWENNHFLVMKSSLDPQKIYDFMTSAAQTGDVFISIVNRRGFYQLVSSDEGKVLDSSGFMPPLTTKIGLSENSINNEEVAYAFSWLNEVDWAVIVRKKNVDSGYWNLKTGMVTFSIITLLILFAMIIYRSNKIAMMQIEKDITRSQLEHASKLASVGELAGGIAHEINNPLAIIASEVGLIKDIMDPRFGLEFSYEKIEPRLKNIHEAAFRCRDITRKLLSFVRQDDIELKQHNINDIIDDLIEGFFARELKVSNIEIKRHFQDNIPAIITDSNQFRQVVLNIINNAVDAITPPGMITFNTAFDGEFIIISITDSGKGINEEDINKIFMPFFTTKEVGKGTGLGLSVSYGIIKNLGGNIEVESIHKKGTTFKIKLPIIKF